MQQPPIDQSQIDARISGHEQELLHLWQAEQGGAAKDRDLQIAASCIPFPRDRALRTVDLGCGPGDMGARSGRTTRPRRSTSSIAIRSCCRSAADTTGRRVSPEPIVDSISTTSHGVIACRRATMT